MIKELGTTSIRKAKAQKAQWYIASGRTLMANGTTLTKTVRWLKTQSLEATKSIKQALG